MKLPKLVDQKIYKTGQTRGADDDQIFQNRVGRNNTVLIPFAVWENVDFVRSVEYERGYIVLVPPSVFFQAGGQARLDALDLELGRNALVFYEQRGEWLANHPDAQGWHTPTSRTAPLGGEYVARIANTTRAADERINVGYTETGLKGAGIRQFEYAPSDVIAATKKQLCALFFSAVDATDQLVEMGYATKEVTKKAKQTRVAAERSGLLDWDQLQDARIVNRDRELVCPLCLEPISSLGFMSRLPQATGRERHDLTVTEINLFHIEELAYGKLNHRPYNLGWGHHHCNVVCKDSGILPTLEWMKAVIDRNAQ